MKRLRRLSALQYFVVKATLFLLCLAPAAMAGIALPQSVDPVEFLTRESGTNALRFLIITLCITPLRLATGLNWLIKLRRMFGLFTFSYAAVHFSVYLFWTCNWIFPCSLPISLKENTSRSGLPLGSS